MMTIYEIDLMDGKPIKVVFASCLERDRFIEFYKLAVDSISQFYEDQNDYRGMGWIGKDGRP